jgi:hypothetical protein
LPVEKQQAAVLKVMPEAKASEAARTRIYGDLAKINIRQATSVEAQASILPLPAKLKLPADHLKSIANLHGQIFGPGVIIPASEAGPIVSMIIAAAVSFVVDKVFQFLADVIGDDVFKPVTASISIQSLTQRFAGGKTDCPDGVATFRGHGGEYKIVYDWRLYA